MTASTERPYPDEPAGPFPEPPLTFVDEEGREIEIRPHGETNDVETDEREYEALVEMYASFDPADRAQGIPPSGEERIRDWLSVLEDGLNVIAWHDGRVAGHATLVSDVNGAYELAIFVHQDYQQAGIGSKLIEALLGYGANRGVEKVWLTVERWNRAAVHLYHKVGFETTDSQSFELEMSLRLLPEEE